jgi:hypothetical protein
VLLVIDTNVLLSGLLWHGPPHTLLAKASDGAVGASQKVHRNGLSGRSYGSDFLDFGILPTDHGQVVQALQIDPEFRSSLKAAPESQGGIGRYRHLFPHQALDSSPRHPAMPSHRIGRQIQRDKELFPQDFARMYRGIGPDHCSFSSMIISDFHVIGTTIRPDEANAPLVVDPNTMLAGSVALQRL